MPKSTKYEFDQKTFDAVQGFQSFRAHQKEYLGKRLRTVKLFAENHDVATMAKTLSLNKNTIYGFSNFICAKVSRDFAARRSVRNQRA
jgi:hypothetical protein